MKQIIVALQALGAQRRKLAVLAARQRLMRDIVRRDMRAAEEAGA
jgi:hypothetical protein